MEEDGLAVADVVEDEYPRLEAAQGSVEIPPLHARARLRRGALEAVEHFLLVLLRPKGADDPRPRVREALIVQVDGVLCRQDDAESCGTSLLDKRQQWRLRRGIGRVGREVPEHLVEVEHRPQVGRAGLAPQPVAHGLEQKRDEEELLGIVQVG